MTAMNILMVGNSARTVRIHSTNYKNHPLGILPLLLRTSSSPWESSPVITAPATTTAAAAAAESTSMSTRGRELQKKPHHYQEEEERIMKKYTTHTTPCHQHQSRRKRNDDAAATTTTQHHSTDTLNVNRRGAILKALSTLSSTTSTIATVLSSSTQPLLFFSNPSHAACLSGDTSPECIGVYKVPIDDAISSYVDTPEHLAKYAPDLKWVPMMEYPKSYKDARHELLTLQIKLQQDIVSFVEKGELTLAGVTLLEIIPRVTVAGRVVLGLLEKKRKEEEEDKNNNNKNENKNDSSSSRSDFFEMRAMRTENAYLELLASLGAADIVIGQALSGRLGTITMAQIQILQDLTNASREFQDLMRALPENLE